MKCKVVQTKWFKFLKKLYIEPLIKYLAHMTFLPSKITKNLVIFCLIIFSQFSVQSQNSNKAWDLLLNNKREEALKLVSQKHFVSDIKTLFTREIITNENGNLTPNPQFIEDAKTYPEFEQYLYAHWNQLYFFNEYISEGISQSTLKKITSIADYDFKDNTLKNAIFYLQLINFRHQHNWENYKQWGKKINALTNWEYCGVFENLNNSGLTISYEPENIADLNYLFDARNAGEVSWYKAPISNGDPYSFFTNHDEFGSGVNYAQTFIESPSEKRAILRIGAGGKIRVWLNDILVYEYDKDGITEMDAHNIEINLAKGSNRILLKLASKSASYSYFIARIENVDGTPLKDVSTSLTNRTYKKSSLEKIHPVSFENQNITYFKNSLKNNQNSFIDTYNLYLAYLRNYNFEEAQILLNPWIQKYPESSFLKVLQVNCFSLAKKNDEVQKLLKNIETKDPNYYYSLLMNFKDTEALFKKDLTTFKTTLNNIKSRINSTFIHSGVDLFLHFRTQNKDSIKIALDKIIKDELVTERTKIIFSEFYGSVLNDEDKTIETLELLCKESLNYNARFKLSQYYKKRNQKEKALFVLNEVLPYLNEDNNSLYDYIKLLHEFNMYQESIPYIEKALENYPYSTVFRKLMGDAYFFTDKKKKALQYYTEALDRNPTNKKLRKQILDIKKEEDPLVKVKEGDFYNYIKNNRNKIKENNYGMNLLMDQMNVLVYEKGGGKYTGTYIYEVTSQKGIEELKEYNLGLSGDYVIYKSEIVKPNGSLVPAEKSGSRLVFNGLEIGDIVLIDYESSYSKSGRFYKDFIDTQMFKGFDPIHYKVYRIVTKKDNLRYKTTQGEIPLKKYKLNQYNVYQWEQKNIPSVPLYEAYMPNLEDVAPKLHISTITSWNEISKWYSDLVRSQVIIDQPVKDVFNTLFPNGIESLSENEKAKRIYNYVTGDFTYSYVSFKQSGFVPQKPSKTISTKLGDCKDFSTLFVALAKLAKLDARLMLILTSDNGKNSLVMPSTDFNHCIVKVMIEGKEQFLELTDKYLPYKSLPISLHDAHGLEIPYTSDSSKQYDLITLTNLNRNKDSMTSDATVIISADNEIKTILNTKATGHINSKYIALFEEKNPTVLSDELQKEISKRISQNIQLISIDEKNINKNLSEINFKTTLSLTEKINTIGSLKAVKIPFFLNPYNQSIIDLDKRKYPIAYKKYENLDTYEENITVQIPQDQTFIEIPKDRNLQFKDHSYAISFSQIAPNKLVIKMKSSPGKNPILPNEYEDFKKYVTQVLEVKKEFLAFK